MAQYSLRLRRALSLSSSLLHQQQFQYIRPVSPFLSISPSILSSKQNAENPSFSFNSELQFFKSFRSSALAYRNQRSGPIDDQEIGPDTILFEGCDYNHWLITMDLPKEYTPEQKVEAYVRAATQVFGSEEEAKKRIYACSTSVYIGFQVECSEETSEKFKEVEGVVFVLPDSYIDPVNKEYGGDKYVNGTIIPRPPPIQYGRREGRSSDRRPRVQNRGPMQGDNSNFGPPQNPPAHQNYGPMGGQPPNQNYGMPLNPPIKGPQQNYGPAGGPPPQQNYGMPLNHPTPTQAPQQNYAPQRYPQGQYYGQQQNSPPGYNYGQQQNSSPGYNYGQPQNHPPHHGPSFTGHQNFGASGAINYGPTSAPGGWNDYQGGRRDFQQQDQRGYPSADQSSNQALGGPRQDMSPGYGQRYSNNAEELRFSQSGYENNMQGGEQRHHNTAAGVADQQRY